MLGIEKKIKILRQNKGWSQADVAKMLNISVPAFSKIETGITDINISKLKRLTDIFDISLLEIFSTGEVHNVIHHNELEIAKETINAQIDKISELREYVIKLYEEIHKSKKSPLNTKNAG